MPTLTEGKHPLEFVLTEGNGNISRDEVTIAAAAAAILPGTLLGRIAATGFMIPYLNGAVDGSQAAVAIACYAVPNLAVNQKATVISRDAEVMESELTGLDTPARADLLAVGIIVR